ncbi:MAG: DNA translocase FtsK 4TM domain-containing protein [Rickettsiales bacterium]|jgi:S-DNA-T family DNA segregation ATPase FtsK/SpoIIIE|nr:DNA translocase FtsK 4TM domain-containing protein [Rickettsiales bacterium]
MRYKDLLLSTYERIYIRIRAFVWFILATTLLIMITTYSSNDRSLNSISTNIEIHNYMGKYGAYVADFFIQAFGEVGFFFIFLFYIFAYNTFLNRFVYIKSKKTIAFIGIFFSTNIVFESGFFGVWICDMFYYIPMIVLQLASCLIFFISFTILADIRHKKWLVYSTKFYRFNAYILSKISLFKKRRNLVETKEEEIYESLKPIPSKKIVVPQQSSSKVAIVSKDEIVFETKTEIKSSEKEFFQTKDYKLPIADLLKNPTQFDTSITKEECSAQLKQLKEVLKNYRVDGKISQNVKIGPIVTLYEFEPIAGTKGSRIIGLENDFAREMEVASIRISTANSKNAFNFEIPNKIRETIYIKTLINSEEYRNSKAILPIILGTDISGKAVVIDLTKTPHLLVAGTTGSGKSVGINTMIASLLYKFSPTQCKFIMIDPKMLELSVYDGIPHLLTPVITRPHEANNALKWACKEMDERYRIMAQLGVRNIEGYNEQLVESVKNNKKLSRKIQVGFDNEKGEPIYNEVEIQTKEMPYLVIIIDEMADLMIMAKKDIEASVQRISQKARAAGIHLIMATQRPSTDVITGVIKSNFPSRIGFQVSSSIDSRTILGANGAEQLLGKGDMLYMASGGKTIRVHGPFVSDNEVEKIVTFIKSQGIEPQYINDMQKTTDVEGEELEPNIEINNGNTEFNFGEDRDDILYKQALEIVKTKKKSSASYLQTALGIGYPKAAKVIERLEKNGVLSEPNSNGRRDILIDFGDD